MDLDFELTERSLGSDAHVIAVRGELDLFTAPELRALINDLIDQGKTGLVIDLAATSFIDSSGLASLVGALKRVAGAGGRLVLVDAGNGSRLARTLTLTGLDRVLEVQPDCDSAIAALRAARDNGGIANGHWSDWRALRT
jgi:anti-sigma B factor antagonist